MKKKLIPTNNPIGSGTTQWADAIGPQQPDWVNDNPPDGSKGSSGFSWNNFVSNLGNIFSGIGDIVGNANSYSRTTDNTNRNINDTTGRIIYRNSTTITVIILGGIAVLITLILVLGKK